MLGKMENDEVHTARCFLKQTGWLAETPPSFADKLLARCSLVSVDRRERVYQIGDEPDGLYGVVAGGFAFEMAPHERGPHLAHIFRPGFWFGDGEQFAVVPRIATIRATRPSKLLHIPQLDFMELVATESDTWRWIGLLGFEHLTLALGIIDDASIPNPWQRIGALLLRLANVRMADREYDPTPEIDITQEDLARLATLSRSTVSAHLNDLEKAGLIERIYGRLTLLDPSRLRRQIAIDRLN
jgi:CRP/FNR family transcriptional regulator, cyclic AMP receptor protein